MKHTGKRIWHAADIESGKITAQAEPSILHSSGTNFVEHTIIPATITSEKSIRNQNRFRILGISLKKLDRCTSLTVAVQVMLYEKRWARMACDTGIERPPKKKKLEGKGERVSKKSIYENARAGLTKTGSKLNSPQVHWSTSYDRVYTQGACTQPFQIPKTRQSSRGRSQRSAWSSHRLGIGNRGGCSWSMRSWWRRRCHNTRTCLFANMNWRY